MINATAVRGIAAVRRGLLLCLVALQQATVASAGHCEDFDEIGRVGIQVSDDDACYEEACAAIGCEFGCINDFGPGLQVCDSHSGEFSASDWNSFAKDSACRCQRDLVTGVSTCERVPCAAALDLGFDLRGDNSCVYSYDGMCDEGAFCAPRTDCSDCGNCGDCDEDCEAAAQAVVVIFLLGSVCTCIALGGGIYCCIKSRSQALGGRPSAMAWLGSLLICFFLSPLCMWIPFVIDGCYEQPNRPMANVVITQQTQQPYLAQGQPMMVQAQGQPIMAVATAVPMATAQAQAQPMAVAQAQPMAKAP